MSLLRRLTYMPTLRATARHLHVSGALRRCYYGIFSSPDGVVRVSVAGIDAEFYAPTAADLRSLEDGILRERGFLKALRSALRPGDVFFDIGAHVGLFSVLMAKAVGARGQVIAFEPETRAHQRLESNIALNGLTNVRVFQKALGHKNMRGQLFVGGHSCPSLVAREADPRRQSASQEIDIIQGDWLVGREGLPIPRAVKIDIEGYEYSALRGLRGTLAHLACELLCCEIHPTVLTADATVDGIVECIRGMGFSQLGLPPHSYQMHMIARKSPAGHATD
jgi:FkbM family methyltransferase